MDTKYKSNRIFASILGVVAILAIAFPAMGSVSAQESDPSFTVFPEQGVVEGWGWPLDAVILMTIDDPGTEASPDLQTDGTMVLTPWDPGSGATWLWIEFSDAYSTKPGDIVTLTDGVTPKTHMVQNLSITEINPDENTVFGTAADGQVVTLWSWEDPEGRRIETDGSENWGVDFDDVDNGGFDLVPGNHVRAEVRVAGNDTAVDWAVPEPPPVPWRDEFDGLLASDWYWVNENQDKWNLTENPGFLRMLASPYGTGGENLLLRPVAEGDFSIETRVLFAPDTNFQIAGLVIWQDENNFLQLGRAFCDIEGPCVGNGIYFDKIADGVGVDSNFAAQLENPFDPAESYLRLERRGEMVRAFYSHEGITWTEIGTHWIPTEFQVNGVGLTSAQDQSDLGIPADFDYFEMTEGWGFLPEGFHDGEQNDVPSWACNVNGWTADPDDRMADLAVEVDVDGAALPDWLYAGEYREDLDNAGVCVDGNCSFSKSLWGTISSYEPHSIVVYAQDIPSGEWVQLSSSPKDLTCRTYDIYAYDPLTGTTQQITNLRDTDEYNPSWSPNGKLVAHDVVRDTPYGTYQSIYITDVKTDVSTPLAGTENGGNDAAWSPNGKWIAFDRPNEPDPASNSSIYIVPTGGGTPIFVRDNAVSADWAPNGKRLVFQNQMDESIITIAVDGGKGGETFIAASGTNPAWSPDGNWIAYENNGDIWKVQVNVQGTTFGDPIQVTSGPFWDGHPTWSADSAMIVYHNGFNNADYDLWTIPAAGGEPTWLTGAPNFGDYDPAYAKNSSTVAYGSFSPEGQTERTWVAAFTYNAGTWDVGTHTYQFWIQGAPSGSEQSFVVDSNAPSYDGLALIRPLNTLRAQTPDGCANVDAINPAQETQFHIGWTFDGIHADAQAFFESLMAQVRWDTTDPADMTMHEIFPLTPAVDWSSYTCTFTSP